ncbi:hypothetical protein [Gracilibacillus sp. YIM 98692]|uniref:hypothetical protein n=1 Tax=Gracilibacillus sp. YIM 98692 TaxID=2663532 RepID=UPI0013D55F01|nr:hypothetical protein [Gracilibacillus sp. YIM 98692]
MPRDPKKNKSVEDMLQKLPKIEDKRSKHHVYQRVQEELHHQTTKRKKWKLWIPAAATACSIVLIFLIVRSIDFQTNDMASDETRSENSNDANHNMAIQESERQADDTAEEEQAEFSTLDQDDEIRSETYHLEDEGHPELFEVYTAWKINNAPYFIPITIMDPSGGGEFDYFFQDLRRFIDIDENGLQDPQIRLLDFDIRLAESHVNIHMDNQNYGTDNQLTAPMYQKIISLMFAPYGIEQITLSGPHPFVEALSDNNGNMELDVQLMQNVAYKIYQYQVDSPTWLVPISSENLNSLEDALTEMKTHEEVSTIQATIPLDADLNVEREGEMVNIHIDSSSIQDNQQTINMVEAILMSAKSFGYEQVDFEIGIQQAGKYDLSTPVEIPKQMNPIILH